MHFFFTTSLEIEKNFFAYNSTKQILYKISQEDFKLKVVYDEIAFNSKVNCQVKRTKNETHILLQTDKNEIVLLGGVESKAVYFVSVLEKIPGDEVINFECFTEDKVICLSSNGYLSCYLLKNTQCEMITVKSLNLNSGEVSYSLTSNAKFNKICLGSLEKKEDGKAEIKARVFEYDFVDNFFALKFDKSLGELMEAKETDLNFKLKETILFEKQILRGDPVLAFSIFNKNSSVVNFYVLEDDKLRDITNLEFENKVSKCLITQNKLWILQSNDSLNLYQ